MDYTQIESKDNFIIIKDVKNFQLEHIFECGQCFRWAKNEKGNFIGVAFNKVIEVEKNADDVIIYNCNEEDFYNIWENYFDLKRNYSDIKDKFKDDAILKKSVSFGSGIRLLRQEPFEIVLSFIISANNRIPMIKKAINNISKKWGKEIEYNGEVFYAFPHIEDLQKCTIEDLESCGVGFRAKYIKDTVDKIYKALKAEEGFEKYNIYNISKMDDNACFEALQAFNGIGPKVADCIMLFSMQKYSAFPVDVWVKRAMMFFYVAPDVSLKKIRDFGREKFGMDAGFVQQYLFYYARENNIKID